MYKLRRKGPAVPEAGRTGQGKAVSPRRRDKETRLIIGRMPYGLGVTTRSSRPDGREEERGGFLFYGEGDRIGACLEGGFKQGVSFPRGMPSIFISKWERVSIIRGFEKSPALSLIISCPLGTVPSSLAGGPMWEGGVKRGTFSLSVSVVRKPSPPSPGETTADKSLLFVSLV
jgi:hypothetical protein